MDSFRVLDTTGTVRKVNLSEMGNKRKSNVSFDKLQNQITARDEVTVIEGNYKDKEGTVKYVHRHHVFIQARGLRENGGIFVVRSNSVVKNNAAGGTRDFNTFVPRSPFIGGDPRGRGRGSNFRGAGRGRGRNNPMVGKKVKVIRGQYKGYDAIIREANDTNFRVELTSKSKIISLAQEHVKLAEESHYDPYHALHSGKTPMLGDRTPMVGDRTPMLGDRTPMIGDRTPMVGDRTPKHSSSYMSDDWGRDYSHDRNDSDVVTPKFDIVSPYGQIGTPNDMVCIYTKEILLIIF